MTKCTKNAQKLRKSFILWNLIRREQHQPETTYLAQIYDNNEIWTKKMGEFGFRQSVRKQTENCRKVLFYESYFEESHINQKPLIWSHDKIIMKFGLKKLGSFGFHKLYKKSPKIRKKYYFTKLMSKRVISTGNYLFCSYIS